MRGTLARVVAFLPVGADLTPAEFRRRHRAILILLWAQAAGTLRFGLLNHVNPPVAVSESLLIAGLRRLPATEVLPPRFRSASATLSLITTSPYIVHSSAAH